MKIFPKGTLLSMFLLFFCFSGCEEEKIEKENQFKIEALRLAQDFTEESGSVKIPVQTNLESEDWDVESTDSWCTAAKSYDSSDNSITILVSANEGVEARETTVAVRSTLENYTIKVRQLGYGPAILVKEHSVELENLESQFSVTVTSNVEYTADISMFSWINEEPDNTKSGEMISHEYLYTADDNLDIEPRSAIIRFVYTEDSLVSDTCVITQKALVGTTEDLQEDTQVNVQSATASSEQPGTGIQNSIDNDKNTFYHSAWSNTSGNYFPITLDYYFENVPEIDYIIYYPREDGGSNGRLKEFELWIATEETPTLTKYGDYNFQGKSSSSRVTFSNPVLKPTQIEFVVKSGVGDTGEGFVSCAEMEFYRYNQANEEYMAVFSDKSCSQLKRGITEADIDSIDNSFFRSLALKIYRGEYDSEFRVQRYKPYTIPDVFSAENRTSPYSLRDNPTGIYVDEGDELVVFADDFSSNISLFIQNNETAFSGRSYSIAPGINKITAETTGLIYVEYHTLSAQEAPVKIHFATGNVNGYFDKSRHSQTDWQRLLSAATYSYFDVLGEYAHLTFETSKFRNYTPDGLALINKYDDLVYQEWKFMGYEKYNRMPGNRIYFLGIKSSYMYASNYYTAYESSTLTELCDLNKFSTSSCWGPAHEVGHSNQTRPGLRWIGMTEVTNNIHSLFVQTSWGNTSRLITDGTYTKALNELANKNLAHNANDDVFVKLVPFWQLKLYLIDALGKQDFYKDLYEYMRNQNVSAVTNDGYYQLDFVRAACRIANLDLTDFFETWGFLTPIDKTIEDYSTKRFTITKEEIDALKAEIAAENYPMPEHNDIHLITDNNISNFK